jgi:hypothetical protein
MLEINKDTVIISRKKWDELKKNDYYREIIEVLEDSEELEKAKKETTSFVRLKDYIKEREKKEQVKKHKSRNSRKRIHVRSNNIKHSQKTAR